MDLFHIHVICTDMLTENGFISRYRRLPVPEPLARMVFRKE